MKNRIYLTLLAIGVLPLSLQATDNLLFGYCGEISRGLGSATPGTNEKAAIEIPQDLADIWAGNKLTEVYVGYGTSAGDEITVFISESLDADPVYSQNAIVENKGGWNKVVLDMPYELTGSPFFVGYSTYINNANDKPIGIDDVKNQDLYGGWIEIDGRWDNYAKFFGNVCIKLMLEGDNLPQNNATLDDVGLPLLVQAGTPFSITLTVTNNGVRPIEDVSAEISIGGVAVEAGEVSFPDGIIPSEETGNVRISGIVCEELGKSLPVIVTLTGINGSENESTDQTVFETTVDCAEVCYPMQMVVEEYTGTWCGYCPRGIVGMNYMEENYGDSGFIGIAIHYGDEMQIETYSPLALDYYKNIGYPVATVNRDIVFDPNLESLEDYYQQMEGVFSPIGITVTAVYDEEENVLEATSTTEFSFSQTSAPYAIAFVITENNIGPYVQTNYFTNDRYGFMYGWQDLPGYVPTMYNEVARDIKDVFGIEDSVPAEVAAQSPYSFTTRLPLENVENIEECKVIAMVINTQTGLIVNAAKTSIEKGDAGVESINPESTEILRVYNPQGFKVLETKDTSQINNLPRGIYIVNGKKIMIK